MIVREKQKQNFRNRMTSEKKARQAEIKQQNALMVAEKQRIVKATLFKKLENEGYPLPPSGVLDKKAYKKHMKVHHAQFRELGYRQMHEFHN